MVIAIDFDGTCVTHEFPRVGKEIGAKEVLKELIDKNHQLILFTMRSDVKNPSVAYENFDIVLESGNYLTDALNWFKENEIPLFGIQTNPHQHTWTNSPKAYAQLYIDDAALGCPLIQDYSISKRPFVDWTEIRKMLVKKQIL